MTKKEIHIRAELRKKGYIYDKEYGFCFDKHHWKGVEGKNKKSYVHVVIRINAEEMTAHATFFTEFTFSTPSELEKYFVVYNRVKGDLEELGIKLK